MYHKEDFPEFYAFFIKENVKFIVMKIMLWKFEPTK